jgi:hypothetical protein
MVKPRSAFIVAPPRFLLHLDLEHGPNGGVEPKIIVAILKRPRAWCTG